MTLPSSLIVERHSYAITSSHYPDMGSLSFSKEPQRPEPDHCTLILPIIYQVGERQTS